MAQMSEGWRLRCWRCGSSDVGGVVAQLGRCYGSAGEMGWLSLGDVVAQVDEGVVAQFRRCGGSDGRCGGSVGEMWWLCSWRWIVYNWKKRRYYQLEHL